MALQGHNHEIGDQPRFSAEFRVSGTLTDPTSVKFKYLSPSGTETTLTYGVDAALVRVSAGNYYVDLTLTEAGLWTLRWTSSGTCTSADEFEVEVNKSAFASPLS